LDIEKFRTFVDEYDLKNTPLTRTKNNKNKIEEAKPVEEIKPVEIKEETTPEIKQEKRKYTVSDKEKEQLETARLIKQQEYEKRLKEKQIMAYKVYKKCKIKRKKLNQRNTTHLMNQQYQAVLLVVHQVQMKNK
jgi:hypothetical protein